MNETKTRKEMTQEYNPSRTWKPASGPAVGGDERVVYYAEATDEYCWVPAGWRDSRFLLSPGAFGVGFDYQVIVNPTGPDIRYEIPNGKRYVPAEF